MLLLDEMLNIKEKLQRFNELRNSTPSYTPPPPKDQWQLKE